MQGFVIIIIGLIIALISGVTGYRMCYRKLSSAIDSKIKECDDNRARYLLMNKLLMLEKNNKKISLFFEEKKLKNVAVYGYGYIGKIVVDDLIKQGINVTCLIDKNAKKIKEKIPAYTLNEEFPSFDVLVVTVVDVDLDDLKKELAIKNKHTQVIQLWDVLDMLI